MTGILLFGRQRLGPTEPLQAMMDTLQRDDVRLWVCRSFYEQLNGRIRFPENSSVLDENVTVLPPEINYVFTVGGDGTFLDALPLVQGSRLPLFGINTGRLGFLSNTSIRDFNEAMEAVLHKDFTLEKRMLLHVDHPCCEHLPWALNDVCIQRSGSNGMVTIEVFVDGEHLNTYWCDGLIIATPTGSTAYSLGCGGPILTPDANAFVLTPIASHTLTVRPIVLSGESRIHMEVGTRSDSFVINMDSNTYTVRQPLHVDIRKEAFSVELMRLNGQSFYKTLRDKLMWGLDRRN
ncbi:MAG: NAD(+)/NADH kinase [Bacteroidales bacterium]|nr:NAD(+)/NADH kinase [Bacteroidales bacterium]